MLARLTSLITFRRGNLEYSQEILPKRMLYPVQFLLTHAWLLLFLFEKICIKKKGALLAMRKSKMLHRARPIIFAKVKRPKLY